MASSEPRRLTNDGLLKFRATFIAGGQRVVYSVHDVPNRVSLTRLNLDDGSRQLVYPSMQVHQFDAAYSPDGHWHAFCKSSGSPQLLLVIHDENQNTEAAFSPQDSRGTAHKPQILPDGSRVIFTLSAPGGQQICSVNMQAGDLQRITQSEGINCWPSISPDRRKIAFSSSRAGHLQLYTMNVDGTRVERLFETPTREIRPAWSPDGRRIAFTSVRDGSHEIYVINADGSGPRRITNHPERRRLCSLASRTAHRSLPFRKATGSTICGCTMRRRTGERPV